MIVTFSTVLCGCTCTTGWRTTSRSVTVWEHAATIAVAAPTETSFHAVFIGPPCGARTRAWRIRTPRAFRFFYAASTPGGELKPDAVLRMRVKQGNTSSFLGRDYELQKDWEKQTGILLDVSVMPQVDSLEIIRRSNDIDLTIARNHEYPDLVEGRLIEDLTPLLQRFGFALPVDTNGGYMLLQHQAMVGDRVVAIPADLDMAMLFVRRDLLEDPAQRAAFRERFKRELKLPSTWSEYQQLVEFFNRPKEGFYGSSEPREKLTGWMFWMPRYLSTAASNQYLFDEQMHPLVDSPAGVAATESYVATVPYSPPQSLA